MIKTMSSNNSNAIFRELRIRRGLVFGLLIIMALVAFEAFNYSTTEYSLSDLLGPLTFLGLKWSTILSLAFCGIDFAGLARLFTPDTGSDEPTEVWYLFGAWLLAATMNATLTWWGVSVAILNHAPSSNALVGRDIVLKVVPVFVALMVWLIRILIIGTFSVTGDRLFAQNTRRRSVSVNNGNRFPAPAPRTVLPIRPLPAATQPTYRSAAKPATPQTGQFLRPEPTYHPISMSGSNATHTPAAFGAPKPQRREDPQDPLS